jgi:hypothetical protein
VLKTVRRVNLVVIFPWLPKTTRTPGDLCSVVSHFLFLQDNMWIIEKEGGTPHTLYRKT